MCVSAFLKLRERTVCLCFNGNTQKKGTIPLLAGVQEERLILMVYSFPAAITD
jgi:hypothetical protein